MALSLGGGSGGGFKADINVTPLVDVVLVLLIIFMVITPILTRGKDVQLPVAASSQGTGQGEARDAIVLTITADKRLWLEAAPVTHEALTQVLSERFRDTSFQDVLIKADSSVTVKELRPVLQKLKQAGATEIGFAVLGKEADE